jgi:hypothetical protein
LCIGRTELLLFLSLVDKAAFFSQGRTISLTACLVRAILFNSSGVRGVSFRKATNKWQALIGVNSKLINLDYFTALEEATAARKQAEIKYGVFNQCLNQLLAGI